MRLRKIEFVFELGVVPSEVWSSLLPLVKKRKHAIGIAKLYGEDVSVETIREKIANSGKSSFYVEIDGYAVHFTSVCSFHHDLLEVRETAPGALSLYDEWVSMFARNFPLIQSWLSDIDYDYWQNAQDPLEYEAAGKALDGLEMISNDLPPPLEQKIVDVSNNPARRVIRDGYVEAIGGTMWLTNLFFEKCRNVNVDQLRKQDWLSLVDFGGVLKIETIACVFQDSSTEEIQRQLRRYLYKSGTASVRR